MGKNTDCEAIIRMHKVQIVLLIRSAEGPPRVPAQFSSPKKLNEHVCSLCFNSFCSMPQLPFNKMQVPAHKLTQSIRLAEYLNSVLAEAYRIESAFKGR